MTTLYVIFNYGTDYNDETHEIGGKDAKVLKNGHETLDEAKSALKTELKTQLQHFSLSDFGYECSYEYPEATAWLNELLGIEPGEHHYCSYSYGDRVGCIKEHGWTSYISWCEANNVEWLNKVPQLLCIQEITV